jgi:hypothetical protein
MQGTAYGKDTAQRMGLIGDGLDGRARFQMPKGSQLGERTLAH